jgi:hypothetical protein
MYDIETAVNIWHRLEMLDNGSHILGHVSTRQTSTGSANLAAFIPFFLSFF